MWEALERAAAGRLATAVEQAQVLLAGGRGELARDLLTRFCLIEALDALDLGDAMVESMERRSRVLFGIRDDPGWRGPEQLW